MSQPTKRGKMSFGALQDYLEALDNTESGNPHRSQKLLVSYAELRFQAYGGGRCAICNAAVRHMLPVTVRRGDDVKQYDGLCQRCLEGERPTADSIEIRLGDALWELTPNTKPATAG